MYHGWRREEVQGGDEAFAAVTMREYTNLETAAANLPYAAMVLLGAATIALVFQPAPLAAAGALAYTVYGLAGVVWIMVFMCPYCSYFGTRGCPCGYGAIAATLTRQGEQECFSQKFRRHIPVIVPLWLIPLVAGIPALVQGFRWWLLGLVGAFVLNSYLLLPLLAKRHTCGECPQRESCPWMWRPRAGSG